MIERLLFLLLIFQVFLFTGCGGQKESSQNYFNEAKAKNIQGIYIFIESEPSHPYDEIAKIKTGIYDKLLSLSDKSITEATKEILDSFSFDSNLDNIIDEIKAKYPECNAVIFSEDMSSCEVIKIK